MATVKRRLFTILSAVSLLLCVAVCVMWVRSYPGENWSRYPYIVEQTVYRQDRVESQNGVLSLRLRRIQIDPSFVPTMERGLRSGGYTGAWEYSRNSAPTASPQSRTLAQRLGFHFRAIRGRPSSVAPGTESVVWVDVPYWAMGATSLVPSLAWLWAWLRQRRRVAAHRCPSCGYDLRATPGRCPECGTTAAVQA